MAKKKKPTSTQKYLPLKEIRDSVAILKDGGYRTVLMVNAINFNLKSKDEQESLLHSYQNFLNGLSFPIQIVVQSRTLDLDAYLKTLDNAVTQQTNDLMRTQTQDYVGFIRNLIGVANIMSKTFYIIIPYDKPILSGRFLGGLFGKTTPIKGKKFNEIKSELIERTSLIASGLSSLGLSTIQLNTQELIELFYFTYNPDTARRQKLFSVSNVDVSVIKHIKEAK